MRIDMTIILEEGEDYEGWFGGKLRLTIEQAKRLRDEITKHLRGASRDKEKDAGREGKGELM